MTVSAGNHGLGVAQAAALLGRSATVVVPENASRAKVDRLRSFPVDLVLAGDGYDAAEAHALDLAVAAACSSRRTTTPTSSRASARSRSRSGRRSTAR